MDRYVNYASSRRDTQNIYMDGWKTAHTNKLNWQKCPRKQEVFVVARQNDRQVVEGLLENLCGRRLKNEFNSVDRQSLCE